MRKPKDHAGKCMLCALDAFCTEVREWLKAGGDKRLKEFTPLASLVEVTRHLSEMESRGETQHLH